MLFRELFQTKDTSAFAHLMRLYKSAIYSARVAYFNLVGEVLRRDKRRYLILQRPITRYLLPADL